MTTNYLQALNIGSGLNTTEIVDAIVAARRVPKETMINKQIETREVQVSSLSEIKNSLSSFQTNLSLYSGINGLALGNNGTSVVATITNADQAGEFSHEIEVTASPHHRRFRSTVSPVPAPISALDHWPLNSGHGAAVLLPATAPARP